MRINKLSLVASVALGALMACGTLANAQDTKDNGGKKGGRAPMLSVEERMDRLTKDLGLTDDQKPKIKAVLEEQDKKRQELRGIPRDERASKMQALMDEQDKKFKEILKPDQYEKWEKLRDKMREEMKKARKAPPGGDSQGSGEKKN